MQSAALKCSNNEQTWHLTTCFIGHGGTCSGAGLEGLGELFHPQGLCDASGSLPCPPTTEGPRQQRSRLHNSCQQKRSPAPFSCSGECPSAPGLLSVHSLGSWMRSRGRRAFHCFPRPDPWSHQYLTPVITNPGAASEAPSAHGARNLPDFSSFWTKADVTQPNQVRLWGSHQ